MKPKKQSLKDIEQFILNAGSDHVPTFGGKFEGGIQLQQIADEIAPCILAILESGEVIEHYLEIGSAAGGTIRLFKEFFNLTKIVLIDDNKHPKAHIRKYILDGIVRTEIIGNSRSDSAIGMAKEHSPYDLIMVDGDHSYDGVRGDVDIYLNMIRPGGFMILHDSALPEWGIVQVVKELKKDKSVKFIAEYRTEQEKIRACGVALFRKTDNEDQ